jgi:hypothetical protein
MPRIVLDRRQKAGVLDMSNPHEMTEHPSLGKRPLFPTFTGES